MKEFLLILLLLTTEVALNGQGSITIKDIKMENTKNKYGIEGIMAPELKLPLWVDSEGKEIDKISLDDFKGYYVIMYCFQAWCPGCYSRGLPALKKMVEELKDNDKVSFLAIQTVFEGKHANTPERAFEIQAEYGIEIPFGHDDGNGNAQNISQTMIDYRTGGTPWFIFIDQTGRVVFNDYHINVENAIEYLKSIK